MSSHHCPPSEMLNYTNQPTGTLKRSEIAIFYHVTPILCISCPIALFASQGGFFLSEQSASHESVLLNF